MHLLVIPKHPKHDAHYLTGEDLASHPTRTWTSTSSRLSTMTACLYATTLQNLEAILSFQTPVSAKKWLQRTHLTNFSRTLY
jgi:hypothetical protein